MRSEVIIFKQGSRYKNLKAYLLIAENFPLPIILPEFMNLKPFIMPTDRIKQLQRFYEEDPGDPFNLYALALEFRDSDPAKSKVFFEKLLRVHKDYLPAYYHAAKHFQDLGEKEKAVSTYEEGIALARKVNDSKTARELQSAYDEMMFE